MSTASKPLLARQPILNCNLKVVGYELLCRPILTDSLEWQLEFGDAATSEVLIATFNDIGIHEVTNGLPAFINFTQYWLNNPPLLQTQMLVVEILEHIIPTAENIKAIKTLKRKGYKLALDDYAGSSAQDGFLPYVDIVKIDIQQLPALTDITQIIERHTQHEITWLAEKVETIQEYEYCKKAGCTLFQGYFFSHPTNIYGKRLLDSHHAVFHLVQALNNQNANLEDIARILKTDPQLSYKILKTVNSAAFGLPRTATSIQQAILILGLKQLKAWSNVIALGRLNHKPDVLREHAVIRALLCQSLVFAWPTLDEDSAFTIGLLSLLPSFLDSTMEIICQELNLSATMTQALLQQQGEYGVILTTASAIQTGHWEQVDWDAFNKLNITAEDLEARYISALKEAQRLLTMLHSD